MLMRTSSLGDGLAHQVGNPAVQETMLHHDIPPQPQQVFQAGPPSVKMEHMEHGQAQHQFLVPKVEPVKMEDEMQQHHMLMQRQELARQQQLQAHLNLLNQQRLLKHQQQQLLHSLPQTPSHLQRQQQQIQQMQTQQPQQQYHPQQPLLQLPPTPKPVSEPGSCSRRVMQYIYHQRHRPQDNNISFWRRFIAEYFAPRAKKRWCVSLYGNGNNGRQPTGVFPQDVWQCEICGTKPGRGFETTVEVLPRLCKIKYDSGILEELLFVDMPHEYRTPSGLIVVEYGKAIQESIFDQLRVVRDGQLRIIFTPDLKIVSWEFCARSHEELLPRRMIVPQVTQLATVAQKYQQSVSQAGTVGLSPQELQTNCNMFVTSSRNLARNLEVPTVNDLGYTKRYVRCLQISEVVNSMKDLIDFSHDKAMGPKASLINFPRRTATNAQPKQEQTDQQQQSIPRQQQSLQGLLSAFPAMAPSTSSPTSALPKPPHFQAAQVLSNSTLQSPTASNSSPSVLQQHQAVSSNDTQHVVQHLLQEMMTGSNTAGTSMGNAGILESMRGNKGGSLYSSSQENHHHHGIHDMGDHGILSSLSAVNGFGSLPFDWKSP